jgi:hypothetical protein
VRGVLGDGRVELTLSLRSDLSLDCAYLTQTIEDFEYAVEDGRLRDFLGLDNIRPSASASAALAAPAPSSATPSEATADFSAATPEASTATPEESSTTKESAATAPVGDTSSRSAEDELLHSVGEDKLERLLREMEADGM